MHNFPSRPPSCPVAAARARLVRDAPARFVICAENDDETLGEVIGWGLAFPDHVVVCPPGDGLASRFRSAERALWLHAFARPAELIWIDRHGGPQR